EGSGSITAVAFAPDGERIVVARADGMISIWNVGSGTKTDDLTFPGKPVQSIAFQPFGHVFVAGGCFEEGTAEGTCSRGGIAIWSSDKLAGAPSTVEESPSAVMGVVFSVDGRRLVAAGIDGTLQVWNANSITSQPALVLGPNLSIASVAFDPKD